MTPPLKNAGNSSGNNNTVNNSSVNSSGSSSGNGETATGETSVVTLGCRLNAHESEIIRSHAAHAGLRDSIIVNSCAVTAEATRQTRQTIRRLKKRYPQRQVIVTGCAAQIDPATFKAMPEVAAVMGNQEKLLPRSYAALAAGELEQLTVNDIRSVKETAAHLISGFGSRSRAFVQIQNGCNHRCTFCIIPYGRGNSRSVAMGDVVHQIRLLAAAGYGEVVLTGVDLTSYGEDLPGRPTLGVLVEKILTLVPELPRLRLSSIDPAEVDAPLMAAIVGEKRLMPHLHLSLQAGDTLILKRMKRRHSREDALAFCHAVLDQRPDVVFGADMIVGFPTETDEMAERSLAMIEECPLTWLHVFPYSAREGTPAARMPMVPPAVRRQRAARLRAAGDAAVARLFQARAGQAATVLVEKSDGSGVLGHSEHFIPVQIVPRHPEHPRRPDSGRPGSIRSGDLVAVTLALSARRGDTVMRGQMADSAADSIADSVADSVADSIVDSIVDSVAD